MTFDTPIGRCGITWSDAGVTGVRLPPAHGAPVDPSTAPAFVVEAIDGIRRLLAGEQADLTRVPVDLSGTSDLERDVYEALRAVGPGATTTYGELARRIGRPGQAQAVGQALGRNPVPIVVPCHRVLAAGGRIGGFSAPGGAETKTRLLALEGALLA